jgi:hypothetical protein
MLAIRITCHLNDENRLVNSIGKCAVQREHAKYNGTGAHMTMDRDWQVEIDRTTPSEWSHMIELFDDTNVYQTWSYGKIRWGENNLSHLVLRCDGEVLGMAQVRIVRPTPLKFGMAYLRWGPLCKRRGRPLDAEVAGRVARALEDEYIGKRKLFLRVLPNAFVGSSRAAMIQSAFCRFNREPLTENETYRTIVLDLEPDIEQLRKNLDPKWRNKLSGAEKNGLIVVEGSGRDEYLTFCEMYYQMRRRKTFETTVDVEEFGRIQEDLPKSQRMRILICQHNGRPMAGLVVSAMGDSAIYLLGATSDDGLDCKGAYLLQWTMIKWLKENDFKSYDLGGICPELNPGGYLFKQGLSGADVVLMNPQEGSGGAVSSAMVRAGLTIQKVLHSFADSPGVARDLKSLVNRN